MRYVLGVDGGNTKSDYFLFNEEGDFIDHLRAGTCSHENMDDSYEGAYREMNKQITLLLKRNNLSVDDVYASALGLAGCDVPNQHEELCKACERIGLKNFIVVNDSMIGLKAGTSTGCGISCVNGTGTSNGGIDEKGNILQVGGIGGLTSDNAGGHFLACEVVKAVYDAAYRCGKQTSLSQIVFDAFGITKKEQLMEGITNIFKYGHFNYTQFTIALFKEASKGDKVAKGILRKMGDCLARSGAGIINELDLKNPEVALIGSVWAKGESPDAIIQYKKSIQKYSHRKVKITVVKVPPCTGAIIWALELLFGAFPEKALRDKVISAVEKVAF